MSRSNYIFSKQIYKSINQGGSVRQLVSIDIQLKDAGISLPTPFSAFLLEYQSRKTSTVAMAASLIVRFLNYLFFDMEPPITSIAELTFQHGTDFLSSLQVQPGGKIQYAEYLTKFYHFCKRQGMAEIPDFQEKPFSTYKKNTENIFKGKYEVMPTKAVDAIHEIDTAYLPMFFDTAGDCA